MLPEKLSNKLQGRIASKAMRSLGVQNSLADFSSNDYLGFASETAFAKAIAERANALLLEHNISANGATGSRLLSGNHILYTKAEETIASFHRSESALIFNSGYDANIGFFQSVPQRGDIILYDEYIHASIRDGIKMSNAQAHKFAHNDVSDLKRLLFARAQSRTNDTHIYVITESVFSMDGDSPNLEVIATLCKTHNSYLVVDEAHAIGVSGQNGQGLVQELGLQNEVFARIVTFGKAMGAHGAAILGSERLQQYLVNFARSFIYTTGLPPHSVATILAAYEELFSLSKLESSQSALWELQTNIAYFNEQMKALELETYFIPSVSAIHCAVIPGNERITTISRKLAEKGFDVKAIRSPTVSEGQERLRFCMHSFNTEKEIKSVVSLLATLVQNENNA